MGTRGKQGSLDGKGLTIGIVAARYNEDIEVWQAAVHASPFVPRLEVAL